MWHGSGSGCGVDRITSKLSTELSDEHSAKTLIEARPRKPGYLVLKCGVTPRGLGGDLVGTSQTGWSVKPLCSARQDRTR